MATKTNIIMSDAEFEQFKKFMSSPDRGGCITHRPCYNCKTVYRDSLCFCIGNFTCEVCGYKNGIQFGNVNFTGQIYFKENQSTVNPPFNPGQKITCIKLSKERDWDGSIIDVCRCTKGSDYIIDGCVWSYKAGWLVSISGELHSASDFRAV